MDSEIYVEVLFGQVKIMLQGLKCAWEVRVTVTVILTQHKGFLVMLLTKYGRHLGLALDLGRW